jgi:signal peptidase II
MTTSPPKTYRWVFWTLALVGLAADQGSKYGVFAWLYNDGQGDVAVVVPDVFVLDTSFSGVRDSGEGALSALRTVGGDMLPRVNKGALWGIGRGSGHPGTDFNAFFGGVSLVAAVALIIWVSLPWAARDRLLCCALGLILGGTLGNFYDRIVFGGVRDFLHWIYFEFPVFNFADCCLVCGAFLLLAQAFFCQEPAAAPELQAETATPAEQPAEQAAACGLAQTER